MGIGVIEVVEGGDKVGVSDVEGRNVESPANGGDVVEGEV